jgi:predicted DNA-binding protein (MmcQ/YjbR family)
MNVEQIREYALSKPGAAESFPFGNNTLVFKIKNKIFLLASLESNPLQINVKCKPEDAIQLREQYACIQPGYHMNKKHWNTIIVDASLSSNQIKDFIDDSYQLVSTTKKK